MGELRLPTPVTYFNELYLQVLSRAITENRTAPPTGIVSSVSENQASKGFIGSKLVSCLRILLHLSAGVGIGNTYNTLEALMYNSSQQLSNLFIRNIFWPISDRASCSLSTLPAYYQQNSILWKAITKNEYQSAQPIVLRGNVNILMVISVFSYILYYESIFRIG